MARTKTNTRNDTKTSWRNRHLDKLYFDWLVNSNFKTFLLTYACGKDKLRFESIWAPSWLFNDIDMFRKSVNFTFCFWYSFQNIYKNEKNL